MHVARLHALLFSACFIFQSHAGAAPATLQALVEQAWLRSPEARGASARQAESEEGRALSGQWMAGQPTLGLARQSGRWTDQRGLSESEVSWSAPVYLPGQRAARRQLADHAASEAQARIAHTRLEVAGEVRRRLWDAAAAQAELEENDVHLRLTEELAGEVKRRVGAGDLARVDGLLADQEVHAARIAREQAAAQALAALSRLRQLTGPVGTLPSQPEPLAAVAGGTGVRLLAARAAAARAQAALRLTEASRREPPTVSLSLRHERSPAMTDADKSIGVALQIPLGGAGRNRVLEAQARTELAVTGAEAEQAAATAQEELDLARAQLAHARTSLDAAQARLGAMQEHQQLTSKAFRLGERGLAELLRSRTLAYQAQVALRQQQVAVGRAHAQVNQASGVLP